MFSSFAASAPSTNSPSRQSFPLVMQTVLDPIYAGDRGLPPWPGPQRRWGAPLAPQDRERSGALDHRPREQEGVTDAYVCRLLPLTGLAPDIVEGILDGRQPKGLRLAEMLPGHSAELLT